MHSKTIEFINDTSFPLADANGNCVSFIDDAGNVQAHYTYDAFRNTVSQSGAMADDFRFRFSSKYLDDETGLYKVYLCDYRNRISTLDIEDS